MVVFSLAHPIRRLLLVLCLGAVALAGCGDDDGSSAPSDGDADVTEAPADAEAPDESGDDEPDDDNVDDVAGDDTAGDDDNGDDVAADELPDACQLLTAEEVEALIGPATPEGEDDVSLDGLAYSQCFWEAAEGRQLVGVGVVDTTTRYDMHTENMPSFDDVPGLGDEAIAFPGVSSETRGVTGGRTISISVGGRTVTVSVALDGETPVDTVVPLAEAVLSRL